jgi:hypothetical protein
VREHGGGSALSTGELGLVRQTAAITLRAEQLQAAIVRGEPVLADELIRLKENPLSYRARKSEHEHRQDALRQGHLAVSSILRDWIKGQVTAIECGILSFEEFLPFLLTGDGRTLVERIAETDLLPPGRALQGRPAVGPIKCRDGLVPPSERHELRELALHPLPVESECGRL